MVSITKKLYHHTLAISKSKALEVSHRQIYKPVLNFPPFLLSKAASLVASLFLEPIFCDKMQLKHYVVFLWTGVKCTQYRPDSSLVWRSSTKAAEGQFKPFSERYKSLFTCLHLFTHKVARPESSLPSPELHCHTFDSYEEHMCRRACRSHQQMLRCNSIQPWCCCQGHTKDNFQAGFGKGKGTKHTQPSYEL